MKKRILKNIFSVGGVQLANYVLPLITIPYVVRIVGPEKYGLINFAQAFIGYFTLIINYGFDLTATRDIACKRDDVPALSEIFWNIITAKIFLFIVSSVVFAGTLLFSEKLQIDPRLYILTYLCNIGIIFFPTWFFQGIEELSKAAMFNLAIKFIFTILIFILIRQQSDYYYYPVCITIGQVFVGILALWYAIKIKGLLTPRFSVSGLWIALKDGLLVFFTTVVINVYTLSNVVMLGFMASDEQVGYFSSSYKLITIILALTLTPITQTLYPYIGGTFADSACRQEDKSILLLKIALVIGAITFVVSICTYILSPRVVLLLYGEKFMPAVQSLRIISFLPLIIGLSNVFGIQGMLNLKLDKEFFGITTVGAIICVGLNIIFIPQYHQQGTALAWVVTEVFITIATYAVLRKNGYKLFTGKNIFKVMTKRYV